MIDLTKLQPAEAERIAYAEGFTMAAELFARIAELEAERDALTEELEKAQESAGEVYTLEQWEDEHGSAEEYKEFFFDCFARLAGHYPAPDVSSDYDKSVIFGAIEKGEEADANGGAA
jgi:hypothetical protein